MIVDAHLDLALIELVNGRDLTRPLAEIRAAEGRSARSAMITLPALGEAGVAVVGAAIWTLPADAWLPEVAALRWPAAPYVDQAGAERQALDQLAVYERWEAGGHARILRSRRDLDDHLRSFPGDRVPGLVLGLEGADPIAGPERLDVWWERGVRQVGLAWGTTRYAGGTGSSTALTDAGRELLAAMAERGLVHDVTHLSEEAFWEALGLPQHALCATHANARALMTPPPGVRGKVPLNRFLTDAQLAEVARPRGACSGGVVGVSVLPFFLDPVPGARPSVRADLARHLAHLGATAGWEHVGIGSDVDAETGAEEAPDGLDSVLDWQAIGDVVPPDARAAVLGGSWLRFLGEALPPG